MTDFKVIVDNSTNVAASLIKNIPEKDGVERIDLLKYKVEKNVFYDSLSKVTARSNIFFNISNNPLRLSHLSSYFADDIAPDFHNKEVVIHVCNFAWQGEAQWASFTPYELGLYPVAKHAFSHIDKTISNTGSWSTHKFYPIIIVEDKTDGKAWFFEIESGSNWSFEFGVCALDGVYYLTLDCSTCSENNNGFYKKIEPGESFETPKVLYGKANNFYDSVIALLRYKRVNSVKPQSIDVCFNDYMNCLWAMPNREKLLPLIDAAASVGVEMFCIDDGWFIRDEKNIDFGDWIENDSIFGDGGLKSIIKYIEQKGMKPGIWLELETAFSGAAITKIAPNAILTRDGLPIGEDRRFVNFGCKEVWDYLYGRVKHLYDMGIRYIKNDYNHTTGIGCDGDDSYGAALLENNRTFYAFIDKLIADMPGLVIENCGSGAMRCDNGTLKHFHLQSTSDQEIFTNNPSIIRGMQACMPSEKMGIWSYPFPLVYKYRLDINSAYDSAYMEQMANGEQTVYNMACAFFGIMTLSGHIEKCDEYNLALIKKAVEIYKSDREFIMQAEPVFIGQQQKLFTQGYSVLALKTDKKLRLGIFRNGGENSISFEIPSDFANASLKEIYPCKDNEKTICLQDGVVRFETEKPLCAAIYEIEL